MLRQLGAATGVSRVYIVPSDTQRARSARSPTPRVDRRRRPAAQRHHAAWLRICKRWVWSRWEQILRDGSVIQGELRSFPSDEQRLLAAQGVCSLVLVPIFVGASVVGLHRI